MQLFKPPVVFARSGVTLLDLHSRIEGMHGRLISPAPRHGEYMGLVVAVLCGN
jgi:hypothetical protein